MASGASGGGIGLTELLSILPKIFPLRFPVLCEPSHKLCVRWDIEKIKRFLLVRADMRTRLQSKAVLNDGIVCVESYRFFLCVICK